MIWKIYNCTPLLCNHIHWHFDIFKEHYCFFFFFKMKFVYFVNFKISKLMHQCDQAISET